MQLYPPQPAPVDAGAGCATSRTAHIHWGLKPFESWGRLGKLRLLYRHHIRIHCREPALELCLFKTEPFRIPRHDCRAASPVSVAVVAAVLQSAVTARRSGLFVGVSSGWAPRLPPARSGAGAACGLIIQGAGAAALGRMRHPGPYRRVDREGGGPGDRPGRRREAAPSRVPERAR